MVVGQVGVPSVVGWAHPCTVVVDSSYLSHTTGDHTLFGRGTHGQVMLVQEKGTQRRVAFNVFQDTHRVQEEIGRGTYLWLQGGDRGDSGRGVLEQVVRFTPQGLGPCVSVAFWGSCGS